MSKHSKLSPTIQQLQILYRLILDHQLKGEPLVRSQILAEGTLRATFGPAIACVEGTWFIDTSGYDTQYNIDREGEII